jgi:hypothetical protein
MELFRWVDVSAATEVVIVVMYCVNPPVIV